MTLFCSNYRQNPPITATVHYFHYNYCHHYHFHYHCKMHLHCRKILLTTPLFFFSLIPSFLFFAPSKRIQNSFTTIRHILEVLYTYIYIYSYLHRSSHSQIFFKIGILKNFSNFTGKHLCRSFFLTKLQTWGFQLYQKETPTQVFSCKIYKIFKNTSSGCFYLHFLIYIIYSLFYILFILIYQLCKIDKIWGI